MASLEILVHLQRSHVLKVFSKVEVYFDESRVLAVDVAALPSNWRDQCVNSSVQYVGDDWVQQQALVSA